MSTKAINKIISEILHPFVLADKRPKNQLTDQPTYQNLLKVARLIYEDSCEEAFQKYFKKHPNFLFRAMPTGGDTICGFLVKPAVGNFFKADYAIFTAGQGSCVINLIELERPSDKLFTAKMTPAHKLQTAIGQIHDWNQWLEQNKPTFIRTMTELLKRAPLLPEVSSNGSFKCMNNENIENAWSGFGGYDTCHISNLIVSGRWSQLSEKEKQRLVFLNSQYRANNIQIRTYDQLIRKGFDGPAMFW